MKKAKAKISIILFLTTYLICSGQTHAESEKSLKEKIKQFKKESREKGRRPLDKTLRKEVRDFIIRNKDVSAKDFKQMREVKPALSAAVRDLAEHYGANLGNYKEKIKNKEEQNYYEIVRKLWLRGVTRRAEYLCAGENEEDAIALRNKIKDFMEKKKTEYDTQERIEALKYVRDNMCPYGASRRILSSYRQSRVSADIKDYNEIRGSREQVQEV